MFLVYQLSTVTMMISLPVKKMPKIQQEAIHLLKEVLSIWKIAALIGMTYAARQAITIAPLFHWGQSKTRNNAIRNFSYNNIALQEAILQCFTGQ